MIVRLRAALKAARERLWKLIRRRHDEQPGSKERHQAAIDVREAKKAKQQAVAELKAAKQPNFNGCPTNVTDPIKRIILPANQAGLYVTATRNGTHATGSYHYLGRAVDVAAPMTSEGIARMTAFQRSLAEHPAGLTELFGPDNNACVKNGARISLGEGTALENQHDNHVHVAV